MFAEEWLGDLTNWYATQGLKSNLQQVHGKKEKEFQKPSSKLCTFFSRWDYNLQLWIGYKPGLNIWTGWLFSQLI